MTHALPSTLGLTAYLAYWHRWPALALPWHLLTLRERRAWEAAAKAAIAAWRQEQRRGGRADGLEDER